MIARRSLAGAVALLLAAGLVAGCGPAAAPEGDAGTLDVVTSTTVLADLVAQVGGERVSVASLVPKGGEVHTFDPTPSDVRRIAEADLVVLNGLGLDDWLAALVDDAGTDAPVVRLAEDLEGVDYLEDGDGSVNPHLWLDVAYAARYAERISDSLAAADPGGAAAYASGLAAYTGVLDELDAQARARLGAVPASARTLVSFHDAFPYFAAAYGLTIDGTVVDAPGQDPSAGDVSALIRTVKERGVRAILAEAQFNDDLVRTIAAETGATVVSDLYTDSVGDAPQDTYAGMMAWNIDRVASALAGE